MTKQQHCGDTEPHDGHDWSAPAEDGSGQQEQFHCPGTKKS